MEDKDGGGIIDRSRATLRFAASGHVVGRASCTTYLARYALNGEGPAVGEVAVTRRPARRR